MNLIDNRTTIEMEPTKCPMNNLPDLPFEKILSYLPLEDLIKSKAVSRWWYHKISCIKAKSLFFSACPSDFIFAPSLVIGDTFGQNCISSPRFEPFVNAFRRSILSNLKHLRLYGLHTSNTKALGQALNSLDRLEELSIVRFGCSRFGLSCWRVDLELHLPMLNRIRLWIVQGIRQLTVDAPRLREVGLEFCSNLRLELVHPDSVERLLTQRLTHVAVKKLRNLKYLCDRSFSAFDPTLLSDLPQLKEINLNDLDSARLLVEQKQRSGRFDLKIYACDLLLNRENELAPMPFPRLRFRMSAETFAYLAAQNSSRLADEMPLYCTLDYAAIERVAPGLETDVLKRLTNLSAFRLPRPVRDFERFLDFLENYDGKAYLIISGDQPHNLWIRLAKRCTVRRLMISGTLSDFEFLFKLKSLSRLFVNGPIDVKLAREAFEGLPELSLFVFKFRNKQIAIALKRLGDRSQFAVAVDSKVTKVSDLNAAIQLVGKQREWIERTNSSKIGRAALRVGRLIWTLWTYYGYLRMIQMICQFVLSFYGRFF